MLKGVPADVPHQLGLGLHELRNTSPPSIAGGGQKRTGWEGTGLSIFVTPKCMNGTAVSWLCTGARHATGCQDHAECRHNRLVACKEIKEPVLQVGSGNVGWKRRPQVACG
jgi:hypothetical protein